MNRGLAWTLGAIVTCGMLLATGLPVWGQMPVDGGAYFERCEEVRDNPTEYDRCIGDEINKRAAILAKDEEINLDRCTEFLYPYHRLKYEACVGEEFNKFPEYGPEVMERYLAGAPWEWPESEPPWWDDYYPVATPEAKTDAYRWWEGEFFITPQAAPETGVNGTGWAKYWQGGETTVSADWVAPPEW